MGQEPSQQTRFTHERQLAAFNQNHEAFRSLNQQMWQIPLIAMTLTGGLWFGVASAGNFLAFKVALLVLAAAGDFALIVVLHRLRFVMGRFLVWLKDFNADGFVSAEGERWYEKNAVVRTCFQVMLGLAGTVSLILCGIVLWN